MYRYGFYMDPTYLLVLIGLGISLAASARLKSTFAKYSGIGCQSRMTGAETAARILRAAGITDVQVRHVSGSLTDHYDPRTKTVNLSDPIYTKSSIAAVGVAAHECGHAIQHAQGYAPLSLRSALVPVVNIGSSLSWPIFLVGLMVSNQMLCMAGIILFSLAVAFQLVTLPVEFKASHRALQMLERVGILGEDENYGARKVLTAAALTYVASLLQSLLQLLRLIMIANSRRRK